MPRLYLTDSFILSAKCPSDKDQILYRDHPKTLEGNVRNGSQSGLALRVTSNGAKSFIHHYKFNGKHQRKAIGSASQLSVDAARLSVIQRQAQIDEGINPDSTKVDFREKHYLTVRELIDSYYEQKLTTTNKTYRWEFCRLIAPWHATKPQVKTKRGQNMKRPFKAFGALFTDCDAQSITPTDVSGFINKIESDNVANAALKHLSAVYNWAIKMQLVEIRNPCTPLDLRKIIKRRPEYTPEDVASLAAIIFNPPVAALESQPEATPQQRKMAALARGGLHKQNAQMLELCHFMGILFLTMARPSDVKAAKFEHFDLERMIWKKHNTKGIKLSKATYEYEYRAVPIHPRIVEIIKKQKQRWPEAEFVFPSHTDQTKPRDNFQTVMKRFKQLEGVPEHFQMYDIKRMAISLMISGNDVSRDALSHLTDHKGRLATTLIYDLGFVDPMRPVTDKLGELLGV